MDIDGLFRDVRYAVRGFRRAPMHAIAVVSLLTVAIGANVAIFSLVNALVIRELPVERPGEVVTLKRVNKSGVSQGISVPLFETLRQQMSSAVLVAVSDVAVPLTDSRADPSDADETAGALVSGDYFEVLGVRAAVGRLLGEEDDHAADPRPLVVLSHALWISRFGGDRGIVGRDVLVAGNRFTVIGVASERFRALGGDRGLGGEFWIPLNLQPLVNGGVDRRHNAGSSILRVFGRLRHDAALEGMQAEAEALYRQIPAPVSRPDSSLQAVSARRGFGNQLANQYWPPLRILMVGVSLLLVIACANVAALLMARAGKREQEVAIRQALGSGRAVLVRQFMIESALLATLGGLLGIALSATGARMLIALAVPEGGPILDLSLDTTVVFFAVGISLAATLIFGLLPSLQLSRGRMQSVLSAASRGSTGRTRHALNRVVVSAQVMLAVVLVTGAVAFTRSLVRLYTADTGFDRRDMVIAAIDVRPAGLQSPDQYRALARDMVERLKTQPGVDSVTLAASGFFGGGRRSTRTYRIEGRPYGAADDPPLFMNEVSNDYLRTFKVPFVAGRDFSVHDNASASRVSVVNEEFVRRFLPDQTGIGRRFTLNDAPEAIEIVGVVRDAKMNNVRESAVPTVFLPFEQFPGRFNHVSLKIAGGRTASFAAIQSAITTVNPRIRVSGVQTLDAAVARTLAQDILLTRLSAVFGGAAILLVCFGVYGAISYLVGTRTREIGVRLAIGARPSRVLWQVIGDAIWTVVPGLIAGVLAMAALGRLIASQLFESSPADPTTAAIVLALLLSVTVLSAYVPARHASRLDPLKALRRD